MKSAIDLIADARENHALDNAFQDNNPEVHEQFAQLAAHFALPVWARSTYKIYGFDPVELAIPNPENTPPPLIKNRIDQLVMAGAYIAAQIDCFLEQLNETPDIDSTLGRFTRIIDIEPGVINNFRILYNGKLCLGVKITLAQSGKFHNKISIETNEDNLLTIQNQKS